MLTKVQTKISTIWYAKKNANNYGKSPLNASIPSRLLAEECTWQRKSGIFGHGPQPREGNLTSCCV